MCSTFLLWATCSGATQSPPPPCNLNGVLQNGVCVCDAAWDGPECATLAVLPAPKNGGYRQEHTSSWGGNAIYDSDTKVYHGFFSEFVHNCGLWTWGTNSRIIHSTSTTAIGPYVFHDEALPPQAHNAHIARANGSFGKFLLWHIHEPNHSCIGPEYSCARKCSNGSTPHTPAPTHGLSPMIGGVQMRQRRDMNWTHNSGQLHVADAVSGPWLGGYAGNCNNPSPWYNEDGSSARACEGPGHYQPGVDFSNGTQGYEGPFSVPRINITCLGLNATSPSPNGFHSEDPVIWKDSRGAYHMLSHAMGPWSMPDGVHAFSPDGNNWWCTPTPP